MCISWNAHRELLCFRSLRTFFFLLNQRSLKNCSHGELATCANMAERPAGPLVALWAWSPTCLCPLPSVGPYHAKGRSAKLAQLLYKGGACVFEVNMAHVIVPYNLFWSQTDLCSNSGFATCQLGDFGQSVDSF